MLPYLLGFFGLLLGVASLLPRLTKVPYVLWPTLEAWLQGLAAGLILGAIAHGLTGARVRAPAREDEGDKLYEPQGSTCPKCRRPLLAGMRRCPFCEPVVPQSTPLESTLEGAHKPLEELVAMPGLAVAAKQTREAGAKGYLHIFTGSNKGESILLGSGIVSIGRASENSLILKDDGVSQRHAEVRLRGNEYYVQDVGSKNGLFVNDQRVAESRLAAGDVVSVGGTKMLYQGQG